MVFSIVGLTAHINFSSLMFSLLCQSFSMDVHVRKKQCRRPFSTDVGCPPLYDRGYAVGLASDEGVTEER